MLGLQLRRQVVGVFVSVIWAAACGGAPASTSGASTPVATASASPQPTPSLWHTVAVPTGAPTGSQWVGVDTFDGKTIVGMVQSPAGAADAPVLVVLHPDGGLRMPHLEWAASFTKAGFITFTPCWQGGTIVADALGCSADAPQRSAAADVAKDVDALAAAARALPRAKPGAVGLVGHSGGAGAAILAGSLGARIDAIVAMSGPYGPAIKARWGTTVPEQVEGLRPPLLILQGTNDQQAPGSRMEAAQAYEKLAREKGKNVEAIYPDGAPHDFPYRAEFWTEDLRAKVIAFLRRYIP